MELADKPVRLHALKARPELNGCDGRAVSWIIERGRYQVQLYTRRGELLAVRHETLEALEQVVGSCDCCECGPPLHTGPSWLWESAVGASIAALSQP